MFSSSAPQVFEVPYVEKYRPVTLEDVVGKLDPALPLLTVFTAGNTVAIE